MKDKVIVALELGRFYAHCIGVIVVSVLLFVGAMDNWSVALNAGWVPLVAIAMFDVLAKRQEDQLVAAHSRA